MLCILCGKCAPILEPVLLAVLFCWYIEWKWRLKARCNKHGIYCVNGLICYMVLLTMLWLAVLLQWICAGLFLKTSCNKQHDGIYYVNGLTCYIVLFNYAMVGDGGFTQVFFLTRWYLCKWFNLLHGVVLVLLWCCFNYAMLSGTMLR